MLTRLGLTSVMLGVAAVVAMANRCAAEVLYYDAFRIGTDPAAGEYTVGPVAGQNPTVGPTPYFTGAWTVQADAPNVSVQATSPCYLGICGIGGSLTTTPNGRPRRTLAAPWTAATTGTVYMGLMANFGQGAGNTGNDMGYRAIEFWQDTGGFFMNIAYNTYGGPGPVPRLPSTSRMYFGTPAGETIIQNAPTSFLEDGLTHLIVLKFVLSDQAAADSVFLYLDPTTLSEPDIAGAAATGIDVTLGAMGGFTLFGGSGIFPVFDEFRVSTTFAEAIPELPTPGDTDNDHVVDTTDFNTIVNNFHRTGVIGGPSEGDVALANGAQGSDGRVSIADFWLWKRNRTAGSGALSNPSVPEPSTAAVALIAAAAFADRRCCRGYCRGNGDH